jgi:DNA modification methylase
MPIERPILNKVQLGDCLEGMKLLADNSIDCCVTDPPYGWSFMGKKWDHNVPAVEVWKEVLRVLKPGAHILVACGTRTQHRMAVNIEDAGFEIRDVISWHYGSGFPKSLDVSKAIDKSNGRHNIDLSSFGLYVKECRQALGYSLSKLDELMGTNTAASWWEGRKDGVQLPGKSTYDKLKSVLFLDDRFDELIHWAQAEREVIGKRKMGFTPDGNNIYGKYSGDTSITTAATEEAKQWSGWGTALKPATEFWTLARKPFPGTVAQNIAKHGTAGLNIDACRIPSPEMQAGKEYNIKRLKSGAELGREGGNWRPEDQDAERYIGITKGGRFPANVILDDFMAGEMDAQTGELTSGRPSGIREANNNIFGQYAPGQPLTGYGDTGGASRFFYVAKADAAERGQGNSHPTVKPIALMNYLIKLICPIEPGRIILEPYAGSGTTLIAARNLGLDFIAFEKEDKYIEIIERRLRENLGLFADPDLYTTKE